jgi:hypothetical protein
MQKQATFNLRNNQFTDAALAASRQVWLASLGAAAVTRDWAREEAGNTFRTLVKQGSAVETRAIRVLGDRIETSIATASSLWKQASRTVLTSVNSLGETALSALPMFKTPIAAKAPRSAKARKSTKTRATRAVRRVKRSTKKAK